MRRFLFLTLFLTVLLGITSVWGQAIQDGADRLVAVQNPDGGWGWPVTGGSASNTIGPIGMGLAQAYAYTGDPDHLASLALTRNYLLAKTNTFSPSDGYLAKALDDIWGDTACVDHMNLYYYGPLASGTYYRAGDSTPYNTQAIVNRIRTNRSGTQANMAAWDIGMGLVGAASSGVTGTELGYWIAGVEAEIDELDTNNYFCVIGLAGAIYGLDFVGATFDPTAGSYASSGSIDDLAAILATYQCPNGSFTWYPGYYDDGMDSMQETAYSILALNQINRALYLSTLIDAAAFINTVQMANGGWSNNIGGDENNEVTAEAVWGYVVATAPETGYSVVNQTRGTYFSTIQAALNDAATVSGDLITVEEGTYTEILTINKGVTLLSLGTTAETVIDCPDGVLTRGVWINANIGTFTMDGFTVQGFTEGGIIQSMGNATGTTCHILNNIVVSNGSYLRNGIQVTGNNSTVIGNAVYGAPLTSEWGSSGIIVVNGSGFVVEDNYVDKCDAGIVVLNYNGTVPMANITITGNTVDDNDYGIEIDGWEFTPPYTNFVFNGLTITDNTVTNSAEVAIGAYDCVLLNLTVEDNDLSDNPIQFENGSVTTLDMNQYMDPTNTYDHAVLVGQVIYGNAAMIYAWAPNEVIDAGETQTYYVKASYVEHLRGFTVQVKIPTADFEIEPTGFALGTAFNSPIMITTAHTDDYWVYNVSGAVMGGVTGVTGEEVVLFTFLATSTGGTYTNAPAGCYVEVPLTGVILKDDQNPYHLIPCAGTLNQWILIDGVLPTITINNLITYPDGMTLPIDPVATVANGYVSVDVPELDVSYWDNWNLDYAQFMILPGDATTVPAVGDFATASYLFGPDYALATNDNLIWADPDTELNAAANDLADGTYTIWYLAMDDAGNYVIESWTFVIDKTATGPIVWEPQMTTLLHPCRTTPNANNSIDLMFTNPAGTVKNHIWILSYGDIGSNTPYPEYENHAEPTIPAAPNPYNPAVQDGWTQHIVETAPTSFPYAITGMARGYYYVTIFAEDASGNISEAPALPYYRESISYWPGDVVISGTVLASDISALSAKWGLTSADTANWNPIIDVGPSTDYARRSRPTPDNVIDIEDLMMFAMNYNNTVYTWYPRGNEAPEVDPIGIEFIARLEADVLYVDVNLNGNTDAVKGLNIPFTYGSGLQLQTLALGDIWPENSVIMHTDKDNILEISMSTLGYDSVINGNGVVATAAFRIVGADTGIQLRHMKARTMDNRDIVIEDNPTDMTTDNDDLINVIPDVNYLGKNYPNPFNGNTTIQYGMKDVGSVKISVYNSRGQLVRNLVNESKSAGTYQVIWNGKDNFGTQVSSGIYFFRMESQEGIRTTKGLMIK